MRWDGIDTWCAAWQCDAVRRDRDVRAGMGKAGCGKHMQIGDCTSSVNHGGDFGLGDDLLWQAQASNRKGRNMWAEAGGTEGY